MHMIARVTLLLAVLFTIGCPPQTNSSSDAGVDAAAPLPRAQESQRGPFRFPPNSNFKPTPNPNWYGQPAYRDPKKLGALGIPSQPPPVFQASWDVTDWWISPATGLDTNDCVTTLTPCKTWAQVLARLGTYWPRFRHLVTFHFKDSHTDNTDPVSLSPSIENGSTTIIKGELPPPVACGAFASVTPKNRTTPQVLLADLGASGAIGQLIVNTTVGKSSRAWAYAVNAGTVFKITQPLQPLVPPNFVGSEVDTWAPGDTFCLYVPFSVNITNLQPVVDQQNGAFTNGLYVYQLTAFDPPAGAISGDVAAFGLGVHITESKVQRLAVLAPTGSGNIFQGFINDYFAGGVQSTVAMQFTIVAGFARVYGGFLDAPLGGGITSNFAWTLMDDDVIYGGGGFHFLTNGYLGLVMIDTGTTLTLTGASTSANSTSKTWGGGTLDSHGRIRYKSGVGGASFSFPSAGFTLMVNGISVGCLGVPTAASAYGTCNLATTPGVLDANLGATDGCIGTPNGGSFCNYD